MSAHPALRSLVFPVLAAAALCPAARADGPLPLEVQVVGASTSQDFLRFGGALALDGDTLAVGAWGDDAAAESAGSVSVFVRSGGQWVLQAHLTASDAGIDDRFGQSVALSGDVLVAGAPLANVPAGGGADAGAAYVFERSGTTWAQTAKLVDAGGGSNDQLGRSVGVHGDTIVVGAPGAGPTTAVGRAIVFERSGTAWAEVQALAIPGAAGYTYFGEVVDVRGERIAVGAPGHVVSGNRSAGSVSVYVRSGGSWTLEQLVVQPVPTEFSAFAEALDLADDVLVVGNPVLSHHQRASAEVYRRSGGVWTHEATLSSDHQLSFGYAVAYDRNKVLVGNPLIPGPGPMAGTVHLFERVNGAWGDEVILCSAKPHHREQFGYAVALAGTDLLVGAPIPVTQNPLGPGEVRVYEVLPSTTGIGTALCLGDGDGAACPCGNDSPVAGRGCVHSGGEGMTITASGSASVVADDLTLTVEHAPFGNTGLFYVGTETLHPGSVLFDGLQCAGGEVRRFFPVFQAAGTVSDTGFVAQDPASGYFEGGRIYFFQYWSRDVAAGPSACGTGSTFSPGLGLVMAP